MSPIAAPTTVQGSHEHLVCTTALCEAPAVALVSWRTQPQALPFCGRCADRLASHGDTVVPLAAGLPAHRVA